MAKTTTDIATLKINVLSQSAYDTEVANGTVNTNELYMTPASCQGLIALDTTAQTGTTDGDLYAAIVVLGWASDVIE